MTDTIASRVMRVVGGSVHALLDAVENAAPEATMAQAIREVDQAIEEVRAELGRVEAVKHLATSSLNKLNTQKETLAEQIEIAMSKGDEALARAGTPGNSISMIRFQSCNVRCRRRLVVAASSKPISLPSWPRSVRWSRLCRTSSPLAPVRRGLPLSTLRLAQIEERLIAPERRSIVYWPGKQASPSQAPASMRMRPS